MNHPLPDNITQTLERFVEWSRELGFRYAMVPGHLRHWQRFLERRGVHRLSDVDAALLGEYQRCLEKQRSPATVRGYLSTLRALWRYLRREQLVTVDATKGFKPLREDTFIPHLYPRQELLAIEKGEQVAIQQARGSRSRFAARTRNTAFGLLRALGLRVTEACQLKVSDYDARARTLRIERTKFFKTRTIPIPRSTALLLDQYLICRQALASQPDEPRLLLSQYGCGLQRGALEAPFKALVTELDIYQPRHRQGRTVFGSTNLHALRHTFAVCTLERWQRQKANVEALLPLLSAYMGHAHINYTKHYLHLTPLLRKLANQRFADLALPHLEGLPDDTDDG